MSGKATAWPMSSSPPPFAGIPPSLRLERVAVVERLRERIADPLTDAVVDPEPLAVLALDPAALDLEAEDPALGMGDHEVDLAVV